MLAWLFGLSLQGPQGFQAAREQLQSIPLLALSLVLVWSLSHHLLAGIRHLLLDVEIGLDRSSARTSAWFVNAGALVLTGIYLAGIV